MRNVVFVPCRYFVILANRNVIRAPSRMDSFPPIDTTLTRLEIRLGGATSDDTTDI